MLLITTFVELRVVAGRIRTQAGRSHAVSGRPMLIHTSQAAPCRSVEKSLSIRQGRGMERGRQDMVESNTTALCKASEEDNLNS
jgi:hypothetical protein